MNKARAVERANQALREAGERAIATSTVQRVEVPLEVWSWRGVPRLLDYLPGCRRIKHTDTIGMNVVLVVEADA